MALNTNDYPQCEGKLSNETPVERAINEHKHRVAYLREQIKNTQEQLRIELARLNAVKKLIKGSK